MVSHKLSHIYKQFPTVLSFVFVLYDTISIIISCTRVRGFFFIRVFDARIIFFYVTHKDHKSYLILFLEALSANFVLSPRETDLQS